MYKLVAIGQQSGVVLFLESSESRELLVEQAIGHARDLRESFSAMAFETDNGAIALGKHSDGGVYMNTRFEVWKEVE